jgi:hypothetical protein
MSIKKTLGQSGIMNAVVSEQATSMKNAEERTFSVCKTGKIVPISVKGTKFYPTIDRQELIKSCDGKKFSLFHTHGTGAALPSTTDYTSYGTLFKSSKLIEAGCSVGVNGIFCVTRNGKKWFEKFSQENDKNILNLSGAKKWTGESVFCDKIDRGGKNKYYCTIQDDDKEKSASAMGVFDSISVAGGATWNGDAEADVEAFSQSREKKMQCYGSTGKGKELTCILDGTHEEFARGKTKIR